MDARDQVFVQNLFKHYYDDVTVEIPVDLKAREFGFIFFGGEGMARHLSFEDQVKLNEFLKREVPLHAYFSSAYYKDPSAEDMDSKTWLGADLVFDIDADHIPTSCKLEHDLWLCLDCGYSSKGWCQKHVLGVVPKD